MPIGTRIALGFATVLLLTVSVAVIGWNGLSTYAGRVELASRTSSLDAKLSRARQEEGRYLAEGDPTAVRRVRALSDEMKGEAEQLLAHTDFPVDAEALREVVAKLDAYRKAFDQVVALGADKFGGMEKLRKQTASLMVVAQTLNQAQAPRHAEALRQLKAGEAGEDTLEILESSGLLLNIAGRLVQETRGALLGVQQFLLDNNPAGRARLDEGINKLLSVTGDARTNARDKATLAEVDKLTPSVLAVETEFLLVVDVVERQNKARAAMMDAAAAVSDRVAHVVAEQMADREAERTRASTLITVGALGALAVGVLFSLLIGRSLTRPITATTRAIQRLSEGDLTVTVPGTDRRDELGAIGLAIQNVIAVLHGLHGEMHRLSGVAVQGGGEPVAHQEFKGAYGEMVALLQETGAAFRRIGEQATQVAVAAGEASTAVGHVSEGAQEQTDDLDLVVSAVGQTARAIAHVSDNTRNASDMVKAAAGFAEQGKEDMARLLKVSQTIADNSRRIGRITEAITQIAVKTNILSVNASIEAARAGEQGKGFEVVAEEVGKLADNAVESARQIAEIVESASTMAEEGMQVTGQVGRMMDDLAERVAQLDRVFQSVAVAMEEQQSSVKEIEANVESVRTVASKNAAASEEIAATMQQLSRLADETRQQVARFKAV
ncbi:methyl-accepting chemotaxis protein [Azospirillum soli]|uniref:methyl-accepting chemotaxis protein n=1 Tax=Azospirillum soli TaxID=1304799 RepID=UPI001AEA4EC0|nr:HAMP domain-containing methyl-accepting chemotaxis protein [Azospirillum soli]MBP2312458.1 methyl-accepting chemotaxis protein [Azospirillum soli]